MVGFEIYNDEDYRYVEKELSQAKVNTKVTKKSCPVLNTILKYLLIMLYFHIC
mgnify:CR=1 FL=1|jgi:hypothetical protein